MCWQAGENNGKINRGKNKKLALRKYCTTQRMRNQLSGKTLGGTQL